MTRPTTATRPTPGTSARPATRPAPGRAVPTTAPGAAAPTAARLRSRIDALVTAAEAAQGSLDADLLAEVRGVAERSRSRLQVSAAHTVVAIAGGTGSGKSTLFNALAGATVSAAGARRPMTSTAQALVWGADDAEGTLDRLGIRPQDRHRRDDLEDAPAPSRLPEGLVLVDLPDHDSVEAAHLEEARRVVELADVLVWVVDPQKYADAAIHREFLRPLAGHRAVTMVVLNHVDTVPEELRRGMVADLRRLLVADGIRDPRILPTSARDGIGVDDLRRALTRRVQEKQNALLRIDADVRSAVARLEQAAGRAPFPVPDVWVTDLETRIARSAGAAHRGPVDRPAVDTAVRGFVDRLSRDLTEAWAEQTRAAVTRHLDRLDDRLDAELATLAPAPRRRAGSQRRAVPLAGVLGAAAAGLLLALALAGVLPTTIAAVAAGLTAVLTVGTVLALRSAPTSRPADDVDPACREVVARVVREHVLTPIGRELAPYARLERALGTARR